MEITFCWWENPSNCIKPTSTRKPSNYVRTCPTACGSTAHHARSQKRRPEPMKWTSPWRKQQQSHCMCFSTRDEDMAFTTTSFHCLALNKKTWYTNLSLVWSVIADVWTTSFLLGVTLAPQLQLPHIASQCQWSSCPPFGDGFCYEKTEVDS